MSTFPTLKTGAVMQYPAQRGIAFSTIALQFIDGAEQRFCNYPSPLHRWVIQLGLLDQMELQQLQEFFRGVAGAAGSFAFTDPWDGMVYPTCSVSGDSITAILASEWNGQTSLTVLEGRS
jgi:Conserved hypothetical protein 2217 (DUF2460)